MAIYLGITPGSFFAPPDASGSLPLAERVEIRAFDRDGRPIGTATLIGYVRLEPIDVSPGREEQYTVTLSGSMLEVGPLTRQDT